MKISSVVSLAVFAAILGSGLFFARDVSRARIPAPAPLPAEVEGPPPRSTLLEKGDWFLARGDLDRAAAAFDEAREFAPSVEEAREGLREVYVRRREGCLGSVEKLTELLGWLDRRELVEEAEELARLIVKLDRKNAAAHRRLGHEEYQGEWIGWEQIDLVQAAREARRRMEEFSRLTPRRQRVTLLKKEIEESFRGEALFKDCGPETPWLIAIEPSKEYVAALRLAEFEAALGALYREFAGLFPLLFDQVAIPASEVLVVYAFDGANRYRQHTSARPVDLGHFEQKTGRAYLAAARQSTIETLFHEGTHQLVNSMLSLYRRDQDVEAGRVALWINAGLACRNEAFRRDTEGKLVFEGPARDYIEPAREAIRDKKWKVTLVDVVKYKTSDLWVAREDPRLSMRLDALCWSAVYFFMDGASGVRRQNFLKYCESEWMAGVEIAEAFRMLGDLNALDSEWKEFVLDLK